MASAPSGRSTTDTIALACAVILAVGTLVQGYLASRHLTFGASITAHGIIGDTLFIFALIIPAVALLRGHSGLRFGIAVACAALIFAQIGLGYVGRENFESRAWHIANGVLLAGLTTAQATIWLRPDDAAGNATTGDITGVDAA